MKKSNNGYISLHRKIFQNEFYDCEPKCRIMAWIDLLLLANHQKRHFMIRGIPVIVPRGSIGYSIDTLALRWKWSKGKVKRWLDVLKMSGQIDLQKTNVTTLISIINYDHYQKTGSQMKPQTGSQVGSQTDLNNKGNNYNKGKGAIASAGAAPLTVLK